MIEWVDTGRPFVLSENKLFFDEMVLTRGKTIPNYLNIH